MRLPLLAIAAAIAVSIPAAAADPVVKLPAELAAAPGRILQLKAETAGKSVRWALASEDADLIPYPPDGRVALFSSPKPGRYLVLAWTAAGDVPSDAARCVVTVKDPNPPPAPAPAGLLAEVLALYRADTGPAKAGDVKALAELYALMAGECDKFAYRTAAELNAKYAQARDALLGPAAIKPIRDRLAREIAAAVPADPDAPLTTDTRRKLADAFARLAALLREVSP